MSDKILDIVRKKPELMLNEYNKEMNTTRIKDQLHRIVHWNNNNDLNKKKTKKNRRTNQQKDNSLEDRNGKTIKKKKNKKKNYKGSKSRGIN